ncbi:arrestin domain-containing protein 3-like [Schistocerca americana]|uniref:arrestin domain-containing protein 3-like n=1 Tax=Schistocerca americana TaxID=7009 RepID=UPI001F4F9329|nr:arrestin domain-containing protein 3-like [Schistocerca americana]XP_046991748.1 arrestin domain-containing protein 3-like [Schistocerca americana]
MVRQIRIYLDNPIATYYGGDTVTGKVFVKVDDEEKFRYISAKFRGDANVSWTESDSETDSDGKSRTVYTTYSAHENYLMTKMYLVGGPSQEIILPPGEHIYNFSVILPENLPSSFEGINGNIRYMVRAKMNRVWAFDDTVKAFFTVLSHLDLNKDPLVKEPVTTVAEKTLCCCCCRSGPLTLVGNVPAVGFVSGQEIPVTVEVDNGTSETISIVTCSLKKNVCFTAHSPSTRTNKTSEKVETITFEPVGGNESKTWTKQLKIPSLPPSTLKNCGIIDLEYCLDIKAEISGPHTNLHVNIPITLGTIPLFTYIPPGLLQNTPEKLPLPPTASAPYPPPPSQFPTAPYPANTAADITSGTSQLGFSNVLLPLPSQSNLTPSAPPLPYPDIPPPSYEECMYGASNVNVGDNASHTEEGYNHVPRYPTYNLRPGEATRM